MAPKLVHLKEGAGAPATASSPATAGDSVSVTMSQKMKMLYNTSLANNNTIGTVDDEGKIMNARYQQCALEVKMENRLLGPLQIHQESMQRLKSESAPHGSTKKKNDASTSRKMDPILALRSIFAPRRTSSNNSADQSKVVLAGRRGSTFMPEQESSEDGVSSVSTTQMQQQKELEGLSDLDYASVSTPPSTASMSLQTHEWSSGHGLMGGGGGSSCRRSRFSLRSRNGRKSNTIVNAKKEELDSDSIAGGKEPHDESQGVELEMKQPPVPRDTPGRIREKLGKRRSSLFSVDEKRASIDQSDAGGVGGSGGVVGSSCDNSITNEVMRRRSSIECRDGRSLICKFPSSRNNSPGYGGDEDTLICDWGRRQSNLSSSASSLSNPEEFAHQHDKEKDASSRSLICGWDESEVSILSESTVSATDEKVLQNAAKACTLFDVRRVRLMEVNNVHVASPKSNRFCWNLRGGGGDDASYCNLFSQREVRR